MDDPESMKAAFDQAAKGRLENKRKSLYKTGKPISQEFTQIGSSNVNFILIAVTNSPSIPSCLDRQMSQSSDLGSTAGFSCAGMSVVDFGAENDAAVAAVSLAGGCVGRNNRSASRTRSMNWSSNEGSSCDTMSVALSEMPDGGGGNAVACRSPDHLVNRKALLERIGIEDNGGCRPGIRDGIQFIHHNLNLRHFPNKITKLCRSLISKSAIASQNMQSQLKTRQS